jgi:hydroxymethylglutaryl-CoA reductase
MADRRTSRIPGFYELDLERRHEALDAAALSDPARAWLAGGGGLPVAIADRMSENVIGAQGVPLAVALNMRVNHRDYVVPMAIEEPSVVAAASAAAKLVRIGGGFTGDADPPVMTAQVQLDQVEEPERAAERLEAARLQLMRLADASIPRMVARGGGCRDLDVRVLDAGTGMVVVQLYVDVGNAMGANLVDTVAEAVAPAIEELLGGRVGLRILSNLPLRRKARITARIGVDAVGPELAAGIASASRFAELDPMRAVTHNKGIMNGIDAVALALGQDWRAIEAGAHAYAALGGRYAPLATWRVEEDALIGRLELPLAVGIVGGATRVHPGVRAAFELLDVADARELAVVMAAAGLASNLAALKALAGEGIQRGHMRLHRRRLDEAAANETNNETKTEAVTPGRSS